MGGPALRNPRWAVGFGDGGRVAPVDRFPDDRVRPDDPMVSPQDVVSFDQGRGRLGPRWDDGEMASSDNTASREYVLVTGATGLLGSHLAVRLTAQGNRVRALVRPRSR